MDSDDLYHLRVGGKLFALDGEDVAKLESPFLSALVDPESKFARPDDGIFEVEADAACFSSFLHLCRFGTLAPLPAGESHVLDQADFWGVREKVLVELRRPAKDRSKFKELVEQLSEARKHHNFRNDDGCGRIYCSDCGSRDYDERWYGESWGGRCFECNGRKPARPVKYAVCEGCNKTVNYKKDNLGWCHKCSLCKDCQRSVCPNDKYVSCHYYRFDYQRPKPKTTKELEEELSKLEKNLFW